MTYLFAIIDLVIVLKIMTIKSEYCVIFVQFVKQGPCKYDAFKFQPSDTDFIKKLWVPINLFQNLKCTAVHQPQDVS